LRKLQHQAKPITYHQHMDEKEYFSVDKLLMCEIRK